MLSFSRSAPCISLAIFGVIGYPLSPALSALARSRQHPTKMRHGPVMGSTVNYLCFVAVVKLLKVNEALAWTSLVLSRGIGSVCRPNC